MSRENPQRRITVIGKLMGANNYTPAIILGIRELWGMNTVPDDCIVEEEELSPMSGFGIDDGSYTMEYEWSGQQVKREVRVIGGKLVGRMP